MFRVMPLVFCAILCALMSVPATADDPPKKPAPEERKELHAKWDKLIDVGLEAGRAGKYPDAVKAVEESLKLARQLYPKTEFPDGHADLSLSLNNLGLLYQDLGRFAEAEPVLKEALEINKRLLKGDHSDVAVSLNNLGRLYALQAKYAAAEPLYKDALEMKKRLFKGDHPSVVTSLGNLAGLYQAQGKHADAEPFYTDALEMAKRLFKGDHLAVAGALNNLAGLYRNQAKYADAEPLYKDALEMVKRLFKGDHPKVAVSLNNFGLLYQDQGKYADAESLYKNALAMNKRMFGEDHPDVVTNMNNLGLLYGVQGKYVDAEPLLKGALATRKRLFKGDHPDVIVSLGNLAVLYQEQAQYAAAEALYKEALEMTRRLCPGDHPAVALALNNLANLQQVQGKYAEAELLFKDALAMRKRLFKGDHPAVVTGLVNFAGVYRDQGKYADAEPLDKDARAMLARLFKGDHPDIAFGLGNFASAYEAQAKYADAEVLLKAALEMRKRLFKGDHPDVALSSNNLAAIYEAQGKYADAEPLYKDALAMRKRLFKDDHPHVALVLGNLAGLYRHQGKYADAEPLYKDALEMRKRLFGDIHPDVALNLNNLALLYRSQGKFATAESLYKDVLEMHKRLFKGDHPKVALSLNNLATLHLEQAKFAEAEPVLKDALDMYRRLFKGNHPDVALGMGNLGFLYAVQEKYTGAEPLLKDALEMKKAVYKGDHPDVALGLNNIGYLYGLQGRFADAEPFCKGALEMNKRLHTGDHPDVASALSNLGSVSRWLGRGTESEALFTSALDIYRRLTVRYAKEKSEGEALTLLAALPLTRDAFLSGERVRGRSASAVYPHVWSDKGFVARVYETRQQQARATTDPKTAKMLADLTDARRRRAEVLFAPATKDPETLARRKEDLRTADGRIDELTRKLNDLLPAVVRAEKLAAAGPAELQKALPPDAAVVDFLRFVRFELGADSAGRKVENRTECYLAFVLTRDRVAWVDLGTAAVIEPAIAAWRAAITSGRAIPAATPAKVRELVWEGVRKELPANLKTVYICPDRALCLVPFAALPGDKPDTVLLEDYAVATIPHAPFLLDKLLPPDPVKNPPTGALVVGAVKYDAELAPATPATATPGPLVKPDSKLGWSFLANTVGEANGVVATAERKKLTPTCIEGEKATATAILAALPRAKVAHFATHGFFADASFRSVFQLAEKDYEKAVWGERVGRAANSPLVMTGLVFAGANNPKTPGRGILTGEQLIDLDLSGLELAVLSACETGLGDVAGGEGTFGLQRAFHYAGARNVVCSLWKVPDESTAALMALFYQNLWDKNLSPMESLRQAQLEIYKNPKSIPDLAKGFRGKFELVPGMGGEVDAKPTKDGKAHPLLWAAFTLSGPGR